MNLSDSACPNKILSYGEHAKTFVNNMKFLITSLRAF